jgi:hypothetical protein
MEENDRTAFRGQHPASEVGGKRTKTKETTTKRSATLACSILQLPFKGEPEAMSDGVTTGFVWPHTTGEDMRTPLFTFGEYGFYFFSIPTWLEASGIIIIECLIGALTGALVYYTIVEPRKGRKPGVPLLTNGLISACGVILPFWIFAPRYVVEHSGTENMVLRFCFCAITPILSMFRTTEALFGFTKPHATRSLGDFVLNFASPLVLRFDTKSNKYIRTSPAQTLRHLAKFMFMLFLTGVYKSCFFASPYFPTLGGNTLSEGYYSRLFDTSQWRDSLLNAFLLLFYLTTFCEGLALITNILIGIQTEVVNVHPLVASKSPSDFWGRRWNRLVHSALKGGVYKPVRSMGGSSGLAALAAFAASGLFHEWLLVATFSDSDYTITHGPTMLFFVWQAVLLAGEAAIGHWAIFAFLSKNLPTQVRSFLVILLSLPLGHFFLDSYMHSDFMLHGKVFMMGVLPVK